MTAEPQDQTSWPDIAAWYDALLSAGSGPHELAVAVTMRLVPDLRGARVLDLACGQGLASRALARGGAGSVTGVDVTSEMIEHARRHEVNEPLGISYLVDDAQQLASLRVGAFVFVIGHPCFLAPGASTAAGPDGRSARLVGDYLHERFWRSANQAGVRRAGNFHRTVSTYLNALVASGFTLEIADESPASGSLAREQPIYASVPIFFAGRAIRR